MTNWTQLDTCYFKKDDNFVPKNNIIAFDFDGTLFISASGKKFPEDENDLKLYPGILERIVEMSDENSVIIISNQGGISKKKISLESAQKKLDKGAQMLRDRGIHVIILFSTDYDDFRKPHRGMWKKLLEIMDHSDTYLDRGLIKTKKKYLYVGDAAGRIKEKKHKRDFSVGDRMFAYNIRSRFMTPEMFVNGEDSRDYEWRSPIYPIDEWYEQYKPDKPENFKPYKDQEIVIMVGFPGSGKSSYAKKIKKEHKYKVISRDKLGTIKKCEEKTEKYLKKGKSVIIDNTNGTDVHRKGFIDIAKKFDIYVRCIHVTTGIEISFHLNQMRTELTGVKPIPIIAHRIYNKNFVEPHLKEGINKIMKIPFIPKFKNEKYLSAFLCHYDTK